MNKTRHFVCGCAGLGALILAGLAAGTSSPLAQPITSRPAASAAASQWVLDYSSYLGGGTLGWGTESGNAITTDGIGNIIVAGLTGEPGTFPFTQGFGWPDNVRGTFIVKMDATGQHILFSSFISGGTVQSLATDAQGNIYLAGAGEWFFGATNALQAQAGGTYDAFVAKITPDGSQLLYATPLGGSGDDMACGLAVDSQGQVYVTGWTSSTNFPVTTNAVQSVLEGNSDAFLAILNPAGSALVYTTYIGGGQDDFAASLALDKAGNVYIGGGTQSENFLPKVTPQRLGPGGVQNAFVAKLNPKGTAMEYLTLMGGTDSQSSVAALTVDASGYIYAFGDTDATNFPVTLNCWQSTNGGGMDNFLAKLNPAGSSMVYATYLGGSGNEQTPVAGLVVDALGNAYVAAQTLRGEIAPADIAANTFSGSCDAYVAQINPSGSAVLHLMYLGGRHLDTIGGVVLDATGRILVTGGVGPSPQPLYFPITSSALQITNGGGGDAFITRIREVQGSPANDAFAQRIRLVGSRVTTFGNSSAASKEPGEPDHAGNPGGKSLWWSWIAPSSGRLSVTTVGSAFDTLLAIYTNTTLAQLKLVASNDNSSAWDNTSQVTFPVMAGMEYQIAVDGYNGASGMVILSLTLSVPPNDDFANRITVTNYPVTLSGSNVDATWEPKDPLDGGHSVWWEWIAPISGPVTLSTDGSSFDTLLAVYTNSVSLQLEQIAKNDNSTNGISTSEVNIQAVAGTAFQICVNGGYNESSGTIRLRIYPGAPPANDDFTNRIWLTGILTNFTANNYGATRESNERDPWGGDLFGNQSVWWSWKAPAEGRVTITTDGSDFNTRLAVFTGDQMTNLVLVAQNDDQGFPHQNEYASRVNFVVQANTVYQIMVDGSISGPEGTIQFALHFYHSFAITSGLLIRPISGGFQLQGQGYPGAIYGVEVSTNVVDWELIPALNLVGPAFSWRDTNAVNFRQRLYRLVEKTPGP